MPLVIWSMKPKFVCIAKRREILNRMEERLPEFLGESSKVPLYCAVSQAWYFGLLQNQSLYRVIDCTVCVLHFISYFHATAFPMTCLRMKPNYISNA